MSKSLLYRLFGAGRIPKLLGGTLRIEGILVSDEGISGSVTYRDFRAPGKRSAWRKVAFSGSIALTKTRLLALQYGNPAIDIPLKDERFEQLQISVEGEETLTIAFDPSLFHADWSGRMEYRFHTSHAQAFLKSLDDNK